MTPSILLTLADSRWPAGGHVHSGGVEQAITEGIITDGTTLGVFLRRRILTTGAVQAGLAAAACRAHDRASLVLLDAAADARMSPPAARSASRAQGRGLLRSASRCWPEQDWGALGRTPHHSLVLGVAGAAAGLTPRDCALAAVYLVSSGAATAAQRLLGLDPLETAATTVGLTPLIDTTADHAADNKAGVAGASDEDLPCDTDPLHDMLVTRHAARRDRLFAS